MSELDAGLTQTVHPATTVLMLGNQGSVGTNLTITLDMIPNTMSMSKSSAQYVMHHVKNGEEMGETKIEWCDVVWNPIRGCSRVSEGCRNCYAERVAARFSGPGMPYEGLATMKKDYAYADGEIPSEPRWTGEVRLIENALDWPLHKKKPLRIFVNSMSDMFHEKVQDEWINQIFRVMGYAKQHTFQILTKRPERMLSYMIERVRNAHGISGPWPPVNVWLGVSVEDQATADERITLLLQTPAKVRWVSYEPALGPVDFSAFLPHYKEPGRCKHHKLDWVVCGGESGPGARPFDLAWARSVREQCAAVDVPFFMKQLGARPCDPSFQDDMIKLKDKKGGDMAEWPEDLRVREFPIL